MRQIALRVDIVFVNVRDCFVERGRGGVKRGRS
jgi:hypothetical protein